MPYRLTWVDSEPEHPWTGWALEDLAAAAQEMSALSSWRLLRAWLLDQLAEKHSLLQAADSWDDTVKARAAITVLEDVLGIPMELHQYMKEAADGRHD